jgi:hypothetical protein
MVGEVLTRTKKVWALALVLCFVSAAIGTAAVVQNGNLRITVLSQVQPFKLPRNGTAPIAVFVSGHVGTADRTIPPQLKRLTVRVNRHGLLQSKGLPVCQIPQIQPASTERALSNCDGALIGSGQFWAHIVLPDQGAYPTRGRLLIFNGRQNGHQAILAHIYTSNPFASSFVVTFVIRRISKGPFGTELSASLPQALGDWGYVDRIKLTLKRKYRFRGKELSYFNAGCPAAKGFKSTSFPLASVSFGFAEIKQVSLTMSKNCAVKQ